jgi:hypothetical protein
VEIAKTALVVPPATLTLAGTMATAGLLLERATAAPLAAAGELSLTVPVEPVPPATLVGLTLTDDRLGGETVRTAVLVAPP